MCQSLAQVGETAGKIVELAVMSVDDVGELVELSCVCPLTMTTSSLSFPACSSKRRSCSSKRRSCSSRRASSASNRRPGQTRFERPRSTAGKPRRRRGRYARSSVSLSTISRDRHPALRSVGNTSAARSKADICLAVAAKEPMLAAPILESHLPSFSLPNASRRTRYPRAAAASRDCSAIPWFGRTCRRHSARGTAGCVADR